MTHYISAVKAGVFESRAVGYTFATDALPGWNIRTKSVERLGAEVGARGILVMESDLSFLRKKNPAVMPLRDEERSAFMKSYLDTLTIAHPQRRRELDDFYFRLFEGKHY